MQIIKSSEFVDGCARYTRHTMYLTHFEYMCLYTILKEMCVPYPIDSTAEESQLESERLHLIGKLPPAEVRQLELLLDEMTKAI